MSPQQPKVVLLIFVSGKVVLTGARSVLQIYQAFENIFPVLKQFQKETEALRAVREQAAKQAEKDATAAAASAAAVTATGRDGTWSISGSGKATRGAPLTLPQAKKQKR